MQTHIPAWAASHRPSSAPQPMLLFSRHVMSDSCMDCSPPGSSVHGILQARILEWVAISCIYTHTCTHIYAYTYIHIHAVNICLLQGRKIRGQTGSVQFNSVAQSCPTLCDLMNCNTPGLPVDHQLPEFIQTLVH